MIERRVIWEASDREGGVPMYRLVENGGFLQIVSIREDGTDDESVSVLRSLAPVLGHALLDVR